MRLAHGQTKYMVLDNGHHRQCFFNHAFCAGQTLRGFVLASYLYRAWILRLVDVALRWGKQNQTPC